MIMDFYGRSPRENPVSGANSVEWIRDNFTSVKSRRVLRGGSWDGADRGVRVAYRGTYAPSYTYNIYGFRCARTVSP